MFSTCLLFSVISGVFFRTSVVDFSISFFICFFCLLFVTFIKSLYSFYSLTACFQFLFLFYLDRHKNKKVKDPTLYFADLIGKANQRSRQALRYFGFEFLNKFLCDGYLQT